MTQLQHAAMNMGLSERELLVKLANELHLPDPDAVASAWRTRIAVGDVPQAVAQLLHDVCAIP